MAVRLFNVWKQKSRITTYDVAHSTQEKGDEDDAEIAICGKFFRTDVLSLKSSHSFDKTSEGFFEAVTADFVAA